MADLSVAQFNAQVTDSMEAAEPVTGRDNSSNLGKGANFEYFVAKTIVDFERFPIEPEGATVGEWGGGGDLRCDLWMEDEANRHVLIVQCKYRQPASRPSEGDYAPFLNAWQQHLDPDWVRENGNDDVRQRLDGLGDRLEDGWTVEYRYVTLARFANRNLDEFDTAQTVVQGEHPGISITAHGHTELKDYYRQMLAMETDIPSQVEFSIREGLLVEKVAPRRTLIAVIKGNELRNLWRQHQQALVSRNVREYLGNRGVNKKITATATEAPEEFFYLNNGVTALCTDYVRSGTRVTASDFQIINGAQTVSSIERAAPKEEVEVLMRVVVTDSIDVESGFNSRIVEGNNTQNAIKDSDFRANDTIQRWLAKHFENRVDAENLPKFYYSNKRRSRKPAKKVGRALKLETLAKIRYAYLYDPIGANKDVQKLWDNGQGGRYGEAFGVKGTLEPAWSDEVLQECKFIYATHNWLEEKTKKVAKENDAVRPYRVAMRFHDLALIGLHLREGQRPRNPGELSRLLSHPPEFDRVLENLFVHTSQAINLAWGQCRAAEQSVFSLRQGDGYWTAMRGSFVDSTGQGLPADDVLRD